MLKVYFDSCVYNRPFDDYQKSERNFIEAMAFYVILHLIENGQIKTVGSDALVYENVLTADTGRRKRVKTYLDKASDFVELSGANTKRAQEIVNLGFRSLDALHLAMAEQASAGYFVTCDDHIIKKSRDVQNKLKVKVCSVLDLISEVVYVENVEGN